VVDITHDWKTINDFLRKYVSGGFRRDINKINLSKANGHAHNRMVCEVCIWLLENDIPFFTEFRSRLGLRWDIVTPTHVVKIIEVFNTEDEKKFMTWKAHKLTKGMLHEVVFVDANKPFNPKTIL